MKKKMYLLFCLCLATALLAGCVAVGAASTKAESNCDEISNEASVVEGESIAPEKENAESFEATVEPEASVPENPSYNWEFQKDLPLFVFRPEDEELYWDFPDVCFPYGQARWYCLTTAFDVLGEEMLYHVTIREHVVESGDGTITVDPETPVGEFLSYFEIPFESFGEEFYYHLNLSYRDAVTLVGLMHKAGLVESEKAGVFDFCYCGDLCGATHTVSPALPEWYEILRK